LKKWLREHRTHPYPSNQEKIELAKQSSITYDQVTTWFNNARAILRRRQAKLRHSFDTLDDEDDESDEHEETSSHENKKNSETNHKISSKGEKKQKFYLNKNKNSILVHRSLPIFNSVCCRSIGIQCSPSTANQTTSTSANISLMTDDELTSDRTIRILTPSSHILKTANSIKRSNSEEFQINGVKKEDSTKEQEIVITSTCLDDDQMVIFHCFSNQLKIDRISLSDF
jgi:hypothetical protein